MAHIYKISNFLNYKQLAVYEKKSYLKPLIGKIFIFVISTDSVIQSNDIAELHVNEWMFYFSRVLTGIHTELGSGGMAEI